MRGHVKSDHLSTDLFWVALWLNFNKTFPRLDFAVVFHSAVVFSDYRTAVQSAAFTAEYAKSFEQCIYVRENIFKPCCFGV